MYRYDIVVSLYFYSYDEYNNVMQIVNENDQKWFIILIGTRKFQ